MSRLTDLLFSWLRGAAAPAVAPPLSPVSPAEGQVTLTDAQWRTRLSFAAYDVLRREGTETPYSSPLNDEMRPGRFLCAGCDTPLFDAAAKFDSGTGWPSFSRPLPDALVTKTDYKALFPRTEYHCARCGGHQGHVFQDGPLPTGQRYCNNGVALRFVPYSG
jgi:peptide-methionine (R)-S-oxide reductase